MTSYNELLPRIESGRAAVAQPAAFHLDQLLAVARDVVGGRAQAHPVTMRLLGQLEPFARTMRPSVTQAVGLLAAALAQDLSGSRSEAGVLRDECDRALIGAGIY